MAKAKWVIDPAHTLAEFSVKHMMIATVKGRFGAIQGVIEADPADLTTATASVEIDAASVDTREAQRDQHLRSADFFDVEKYPKITFQSKRVTRKGGDQYQIVGDLTIRGVTKEVTLDAEFQGAGKDPWGNERMGFSAQTKINRKDFGLNWNALLETGGILVGEEVKIQVEVEAIKQA